MNRVLFRAKTKKELIEKLQQFLESDLVTLERYRSKTYVVYTRYGRLSGYKAIDEKRIGWRFVQCDTKPISYNPTW